MRTRTRSLRVAAGVAVLAGFAAFAAPAGAAVIFDPVSGEGFVGKGDVQTVFTWNNKDLQVNAAAVDFRVNALTETTWTCTREVIQGNDMVREIVQQRSSTTALTGLVTTVARDNSKGKDGSITGFYLTGYEGSPTLETDGPAVGSCPASPSGFVFDDNLSTTELGGGLEVTSDGEHWYPVG